MSPSIFCHVGGHLIVSLQVEGIASVPDIGSIYSLRCHRARKTSLISSSGTDHTDSVLESDGSKSILGALARLVLHEGCQVGGHITRVEGCIARLQLFVAFSGRLWSGLQAWKRSPSATAVFTKLQSCQTTDTLPSQPRSTPHSACASLAACFEELKPPSPEPRAPPLPNLPPAYEGTHVSMLSVEALESIMSHLPLGDLAALAATDRFFKSLSKRLTPGLKLSLYPHQRAAVQWMLHRESAHGPVPDPYWKAMHTREGVPFWICTATGDFTATCPAQPMDFRGGFLCDEPGLGKTITGLALILKTLHALPAPPAGADVVSVPQHSTHAHARNAGRATYYTCPPSMPALGGADKQRARRHSSGVSQSSTSAQSSSGGDHHRASAPSRLHAAAADASAQHAQHMQAHAPQYISGADVTGKQVEGATISSAQHDPHGTVVAAQGGAVIKRTGSPTLTASPKRPRLLRELEIDHTFWQADSQAEKPDMHACQSAQVLVAADAHQPPASSSKTSCEDKLDDSLKAADWVACDICHKWRKLPEGSMVAARFWACRMHPEPALRSCSAPEQADKHDQQYVDAPGYSLPGGVDQHAEALTHFREVLGGLPHEFQDKQSITAWLTKQPPEKLSSGLFKVPRQHQRPEGYAQLLTALGFQLVELKVDSQKNKVLKKVTPGKAGKAAQWMQPWHLVRLRLNTVALQQVLHAGVKPPEQRIYLSSATLLVVPPTLVQHWKDQVELHTEPGLLRVAVLLGEGSRSSAIPNVSHLAWDYDLVITSFSRLSADWAHARESSPLLQVHWLRVILDEGHMLGASLSVTNKLQMACALRAERRWVMTGTPTPNTPSAHVAHLQPLLAFLGQQPYGTQRKVWEDLVQKPFEAKQPEGKARLMDLLAHSMTRAAKGSVLTLPKLHRKVTRLKFARDHARSYNELVEVIERNLLLADWQDEDHTESLLSSHQSKWAREMVHNVRMSCCVAGNLNLSVKEEDLQELLQLVEARLWPPLPHEQTQPSASRTGIVKQASTVSETGPPWVTADHPLEPLELAVRLGCDCQACGSHCRLPIITPCGHMLCLPCTLKDRLHCSMPGCGKAYVMQAVDDPARKAHNAHPKWEVPWELIEWQASYTQAGAVGIQGGQWSANWQITRSTKSVHLLKRLIHIGAARPPAQHSSSQAGQMWGDGAARSAHGTGPGPLTKAIVFSQFWMHIQLTAAHLLSHDVHVSVLKRDLSPRAKAEALDVFQHDDECGVLLMDDTGAVGLDLSFVSWVFLMEPLQDGSLETQVVARAHRMGARHAVHVETLVMQDTAEEEIVSMSKDIPAQMRSPAVQPPAAGSAAWHKDAAADSSVQPASPRSSAQQARLTEADRRRARNRLLSSLKHVSIDALPDFDDLPVSAEDSLSAAWPDAPSPASIWAAPTLPHQPVPSQLSMLHHNHSNTASAAGPGVAAAVPSGALQGLAAPRDQSMHIATPGDVDLPLQASSTASTSTTAPYSAMQPVLSMQQPAAASMHTSGPARSLRPSLDPAEINTAAPQPAPGAGVAAAVYRDSTGTGLQSAHVEVEQQMGGDGVQHVLPAAAPGSDMVNYQLSGAHTTETRPARRVRFAD